MNGHTNEAAGASERRQLRMEGDVRIAEPRDAVAILDCIAPMIGEMAYRLPPVKDHLALHWIITVITNGLVTIATSGDEVVGSLGCALNRWPWNDEEVYLTNAWFYVRPAYRRKGAAIALLRKTMMEYQGLEPRPPLHFSINSGIDIDAKERLIARFGFINSGAMMTFIPRETADV